MSSQRRQVENPKRKIGEYNLVRIIGTGTFGKVFFATLEGKSFAIKFMQKQKILELDQLEHINNEKNSTIRRTILEVAYAIRIEQKYSNYLLSLYMSMRLHVQHKYLNCLLIEPSSFR